MAAEGWGGGSGRSCMRVVGTITAVAGIMTAVAGGALTPVAAQPAVVERRDATV